MASIYEETLDVQLPPENIEAAYEELIHANSVEVISEERGILRVVEQVVATSPFDAFARAQRVTTAQLEAGDIEYYLVSHYSAEEVSC